MSKASRDGGRSKGLHAAAGRRERWDRPRWDLRSIGTSRLVVPLVVVVVVCAGVYAAVQVLRPAPSPTVRLSRPVLTASGTLPHLPWPTEGSAAVAVQGLGLVGHSGPTSPEPIASATKMMTALVVMAHHPLTVGQPGPTITITPADVALYQSDLATGQSVLDVAAGEQLTEVQALEGMLLPSGNNMADVLAQWDSGTIPAFVAAMNAKAAALGLHHTHFASPSGLNPGSVSTPVDLVRLGEAVMANPVLASIVGMGQVTLPVAGTVYNTDYNVGHSGFIGIKTGSDGAAGGVFVFDAAEPVDGKTVHIFGAVTGQQATPILQSALNQASALVTALQGDLGQRTLVAAGQEVAVATTPWGARVPVVATSDVTTVGWPGLSVPTELKVARTHHAWTRGKAVGTLELRIGHRVRTVPVVMGASVPGPSVRWRLTSI